MNVKHDQTRGMYELAVSPADSPLCNADISPTAISERHWNRWNIAALWIGMAVCIPTYMLAASLLNQGMNWWQAILTIMLGNVIVLIPMLLTSHPGTKYGIPFPVLSRASFGTRGAHIPAILRSLVACGWFGIQTWIGGLAIYSFLCILWPAFGKLPMLPIGINVGQLLAFLAFWAITMIIVIKGIESIRWLEDWAAPVLILIGLALMGWGVYYGGGFARVLDKSAEFTRQPVVAVLHEGGRMELRFQTIEDGGQPRATAVILSSESRTDDNGRLQGAVKPYTSALDLPTELNLAPGSKLFVQFSNGKANSSIVSVVLPLKQKTGASVTTFDFWAAFFPALTAMVGYWATLSLNIPDFTRYAKSQKEQMSGQMIGLPTTMTFYSFVGLLATCAGLVIFKDFFIPGDAPWDPVQLLSQFHNPILVLVAMFALAIATLSTNLAANVVAPANGFSNLAPEKISFRTGGIITGVIGIIILPWKLIESTQGYIFTWLIGYSALLGPIAGIVIADYYLVRKRVLDLEGLYQTDGSYSFKSGFNPAAVVAIILGVIPNVPGFLAAAGFISATSIPSYLHTIYTYAWFVGFFIAMGIYTVMMGTGEKKK